ncbi:MAG TPA: hypothetical protein EYP08_02535 [Pyrodictiaceae archaeon]|nr:hypothetical protein [Pyrodictiaceae archaeon]
MYTECYKPKKILKHLKQISIMLLFPLFLFTEGSFASINVTGKNFVGTTKGEFSVNQGMASYNLKIAVPPGVAGMEPKLSLNYNSGTGNGWLLRSYAFSTPTALPYLYPIYHPNQLIVFEYNYDILLV